MDNRILDLINEQMNFEYESAYIYKAMAAYTDDLDLDGFTNWLDNQSIEEIYHGEGMKDFLQSVGYKPVYTTMEAPKAEYENVLDLVKTAFAHEQEVTRRIHNIAKEANGVDERIRSFIQWYIDEQVEEEENFSKLITRLERIGDNWGAMYVLDHELGLRPAPQKPVIG
ncbi:ferritin [Anaerococcus sp. AGMB09787]|uniref:ferritin n=1 Tax=Anaerococcus sp. AGMB09787 TaxID=2922869 RepID=UPI001FAFBD23|nr:ferritin [Anaerococcus sp. AGMB09787]